MQRGVGEQKYLGNETKKIEQPLKEYATDRKNS
jgi:hypothetical protein